MSLNEKRNKKPNNVIAKPTKRIKGSLSLTSEEINKLIDVRKKKGDSLSKSFAFPQLKPIHFRNKSFHDNKSSVTHHVPVKKQPTPVPTAQVNHDELHQEFTFSETFNIISEIQYQFENSLKENKKPISEIKRLIDNDLNIYNYILLSQEQKDNITKDIERSSDLRIQNYANVFKYILSSLEGINDCLQKMISQEEDNANDDDDEYNYIEDDEENEMIETSEDFVSTPDTNAKLMKNATEKESKAYQESLGDNCDVEESDFSAGVMLENALILPPKSSPFNYQSGKDITRMRSKKFSVKRNPLSMNNSQPIKQSNTNPNTATANPNANKELTKEELMQIEELAMLASSVDKIDHIDKEKGCTII